MKLYLIRHGQTDWNLEGKIQGRTDIPLNKTGLEQAAMLANGMQHRPATRIFSSPLKSAPQTAQIPPSSVCACASPTALQVRQTRQCAALSQFQSPNACPVAGRGTVTD